MLQGYHQAKTLVLDRKTDPVRYEEAFLGAPAEVTAALCEAYKRGLIKDPSR
jgi:hypothetical protein